MVGVLLTATTLQVHANTVTVTAIATGSAPVQPAVILSPEDGDRFTDSSIPVSGTCPTGYYVQLFRNDIFSGAALCTDGGTFSITSDLFVGRNDLEARIFNIANQEGPRSNIVTVWYDLPDTPGPGPVDPVDPGGPASPSDSADPGQPPVYRPSGRPDGQSPFYLSTEYFFKAAYSGQKIVWDFEIFGGQGPFTAYVVWGDGYSDVTQRIDGNKFSVEHFYNTLKEQREYFSVTVRVHDAQGHRASLQLITIMNDPNVISGALVRPSDGGFSAPASIASGLLKFVWSAYGIVLLMGVCFWLGERRGESIASRWPRRRPKAT